MRLVMKQIKTEKRKTNTFEAGTVWENDDGHLFIACRDGRAVRLTDGYIFTREYDEAVPFTAGMKLEVII